MANTANFIPFTPLFYCENPIQGNLEIILPSFRPIVDICRKIIYNAISSKRIILLVSGTLKTKEGEVNDYQQNLDNVLENYHGFGDINDSTFHYFPKPAI